METDAIRLILNGKSGTRRKDTLPDLLFKTIGNPSLEIDLVETAAPGDAARLAREAAEGGMGTVVVAGGDGTVNEAGNALRGTNVAMGIIPVGSGNGLARSLGISTDPIMACRTIADNYRVCIDCGEVNGRGFFCTFGMGFDAAVTEKFSQASRRGKMTYVRSAFAEFLNFAPRPYSISIGGKVIADRAMVVAVANAPQYGNNAYIAPQADLTDGQLDLTIIHDGPLLLQALAGIQLLSGTINKNLLVDTFRVPTLEIVRLDDSQAHIDGELFNPGRRICVNCVSAALNVIADRRINRIFHPVTTPFVEFLKDIGADIRAVFDPNL